MALNKIGRAAKFGLDVLRGEERAIHRLRSFTYPTLYKAQFVQRPVDISKKRLFVDAGANVGQSFGHFKSVFRPDHYTYHFFEPNPNCVAALQNMLAQQSLPRGYACHQQAVWVRNEKLRFFGVAESGSAVSQGGSVMQDHNRVYYTPDPERAFEVEAISFSDYLRNAQEQFDEIVIKMDIEGAELDVLEHLWSTPGLFRKPALMFVEFHAVYAEGDYKIKAMDREAAIFNSTPENVRLLRWY